MSAFLYGKLPAHGDFVARGLTPDRRDALDDWLAGSLAEAASTLGEGYTEAYEGALPWRFGWGEDGQWAAGALAPSVDSVGRRFPILLGLATDQAAVADAADQVEDLLYTALAQSWTADRLHAAAEALTPEATSGWRAGEGWWTLGADGLIQPQLLGARPEGLVLAMLQRANDA